MRAACRIRFEVRLQTYEIARARCAEIRAGRGCVASCRRTDRADDAGTVPVPRALACGIMRELGVVEAFSSIFGGAHTPSPTYIKAGVAIGSSSYHVNTLAFRWSADNVSALLASTFVPSERDAFTDAFLTKASNEGRTAPDRSVMRNNRHKFIMAQRQGLSRTDASALHLNKTMLVASPVQFRRLLPQIMQWNAAALPPEASLLDIGAGRGTVTASLAAALRLPANRVTVMEASAPLKRGLVAAGYTARDGFDALGQPPPRFGAVALLNVLDRCDDPRALLGLATRATHPNGVLVVATVVPFCGGVHEGVKGRMSASRPPKRPLRLPSDVGCKAQPAATFERRIAAFVASAFAGLPLELVSWTRVPYLSSGDLARTHYVLDKCASPPTHTTKGHCAMHMRCSHSLADSLVTAV